jgi:hypothetical protein
LAEQVALNVDSHATSGQRPLSATQFGHGIRSSKNAAAQIDHTCLTIAPEGSVKK